MFSGRQTRRSWLLRLHGLTEHVSAVSGDLCPFHRFLVAAFSFIHAEAEKSLIVAVTRGAVVRNVLGHFKTNRCAFCSHVLRGASKARPPQPNRSPRIFRKSATQDHLFFTIAPRHFWPLL